MQDGILKVQGESWQGAPVVVQYNDTAAIYKGQVLEVDFTNLSLTAGSEYIAFDEVKAMDDNGGIFGGVAAKAYSEAEIAANNRIQVYRNKGDVCLARVDGTTDVAVGDMLTPDYDLGGFVKRTGDVVGVAAIALVAETDDLATQDAATTTGLAGSSQLMVVLTGEHCRIDT